MLAFAVGNAMSHMASEYRCLRYLNLFIDMRQPPFLLVEKRFVLVALGASTNGDYKSTHNAMKIISYFITSPTGKCAPIQDYGAIKIESLVI